MRKLKNSFLAASVVVTTMATTQTSFAEDANFGLLGAIFSAKAGATSAPAAAAKAKEDAAKEGVETPAANGPLRAAKHGGPFAELIARHANENKVPVSLAVAIVQIESRFNPRVSHGGALGLMQIKPQTARGVGFAGPASALFNPDTNLHFGMRYLAQVYRMAGGDTCGTVMRYQSGIGTRHMSAANRAYCSKAKAIMG